MSAEMYIIGGANGTGKTTFATILAKDKGLPFLNADDIALALSKRPEEVKIKAGKIFLKEINKYFVSKTSFIMESTMSGNYLVQLVKRAKNLGFSIILIYIFIENPIICYKRVKHRVLLKGHDVPKNDIFRRYYRGLKLFYFELKDMADKSFIINNSDDDFEMIAIIDKGELTVLNEFVFNKFMEVLNEK